MTMPPNALPRLTETVIYPLDRFDCCQICGRIYSDICGLQMWYECDDHDKPEHPLRVVVICSAEDYNGIRSACYRVLDDHPRGYKLVPWLGGEPGHFQKLCGPCSYRSGAECVHPDLKVNGGQGLDFSCKRHPLHSTTICFHNPSSECEDLSCEHPFEGLQFWDCKGRTVPGQESGSGEEVDLDIGHLWGEGYAMTILTSSH